MNRTNLSRAVLSAVVMGIATVLSANPPDAAIVCHQEEPPPCVSNSGFWNDLATESQLTYLIDQMSDEELVGQILVLGYKGTGYPTQLNNWISKRHLGSVKIFSRNVANLPELANAISGMQTDARETRLQIPLFVITDQEGGWVRHIKESTSETSGNLSLGATGLPHDAYWTGKFIGQELRALGINMNLAPTVDVYTHLDASVIGPRAFSSDPVQTGILSVAFFRGISSTGVIATAKHFPGHGGVAGDSHGVLPRSDADWDQLWNRELVPYRFLINEGLQVIMNAHVSYPEITSHNVPASLSSFFHREVLRRNLRFNGIVISDDLEMQGAVSTVLDTPDAAIKAIDAGNNLILISHTQELQNKTWKILLHEMSQPEFREKIVESARRVLKLKLQAFKSNSAVPLFPQSTTKNSIPAKGATQFFFNSTARSITTIHSNNLPFKPNSNERILLIGQNSSFLHEGQLRFPQADTYKFPYTPFYVANEHNKNDVRRIVKDYDKIIFLLMNYNSRDVLSDLKDYKERIIVISSLTPSYLTNLPWVQTAIAIYGSNRQAYRAGFAALLGDYQTQGTLPIDLGISMN